MFEDGRVENVSGPGEFAKEIHPCPRRRSPHHGPHPHAHHIPHPHHPPAIRGSHKRQRSRSSLPWIDGRSSKRKQLFKMSPPIGRCTFRCLRPVLSKIGNQCQIQNAKLETPCAQALRPYGNKQLDSLCCTENNDNTFSTIPVWRPGVHASHRCDALLEASAKPPERRSALPPLGRLRVHLAGTKSRTAA